MRIQFCEKSISGMLHKRNDLLLNQLVSLQFFFFFFTCSKISARSYMNLICSFELHLILRYGSKVIACSIINCGRICAKEWSAVIQPTNRAMFDFSYSITKFTRPLTICWHERTSTGEISFFPLLSSLISFGSKTFLKTSLNNFSILKIEISIYRFK